MEQPSAPHPDQKYNRRCAARIQSVARSMLTHYTTDARAADLDPPTRRLVETIGYPERFGPTGNRIVPRNINGQTLGIKEQNGIYCDSL